MLWSDNIIVRAVILILLVIAGLQDLRSRRVSNYITIPFLIAGAGLNVFRLFVDADLFWLVFFLQIAITVASYYGWMGGADWKVLCGLLGMWPVAGMAGFIAMGVWGGIILIATRNPRIAFPAVTVISVAVILTFIVDVSIMPLLKV